MNYLIPDGWSLPEQITWNTCNRCGMIYGDGDFDQSMLDKYYRERYGYGVNNPMNIQRLREDALWLAENTDGLIVDFGGGGDDGKSVLADRLQELGRECIVVNAGEEIPSCDVLYASHVIEHIYNLPETMTRIEEAVNDLLIIDVPDATGLLQYWKMPILDFNTKHINHFTLYNLLDLGKHYDFELVRLKQYRLENAPAYQAHFRRLDVAVESREHIVGNISARLYKLAQITEPVNIWGMGDITWHVLSYMPMNVLDYIDNDPAYRGQTYNGKPVLERPTNDAPIVILAQGQRGRLIENIRKMGVTNKIIEI
jgi:hypothetical protein